MTKSVLLRKPQNSEPTQFEKQYLARCPKTEKNEEVEGRKQTKKKVKKKSAASSTCSAQQVVLIYWVFITTFFDNRQPTRNSHRLNLRSGNGREMILDALDLTFSRCLKKAEIQFTTHGF
ncbi:hypothetical protein AVEN_159237-1 [Araneus ventricosus]|uniref:Uncharacterized protein n=1 Tax=Araneus ventricosus TaxID=182803 RepID=A0A4Y2A1A3_ARAVE|nr:hypothetical protein AVEN_159237-1 [Araneus ventricosus]